MYAPLQGFPPQMIILGPFSFRFLQNPHPVPTTLWLMNYYCWYYCFRSCLVTYPPGQSNIEVSFFNMDIPILSVRGAAPKPIEKQ